MRIKLTIEVENFNGSIAIPINYQYALSSFIYHRIEKGDKEFSNWLHNNGYDDGKKKFKFFTFSRLKPEKFIVQGERLFLKSHRLELNISFFLNEQLDPFIKGIFSDTSFSLGDNISSVNFRIISVEVLKPLTYKNSEIIFNSGSPIVVGYKKEGSKYAEYLSPESPLFASLFIKNLLEKHKAFYKNNDFEGNIYGDDNFRLLSTPRKKGVTIKQGRKDETKIIGYDFSFGLKLPEPLIQIGYYAGFGEKNSLGFGYVDEDY